MARHHPFGRESAALRRTLRELLGGVLDLVLPECCPACGELGRGLCGRCRRNLVRCGEGGCRRCGEPLAQGRCRSDHRSLLLLDRLVAPLRFAGTGGQLVRRFKFDGQAAAGRFLAREMADALRVGLARRALIVSVPLHRIRRRQRGFDQAAWLARRIARRLGMPVRTGALARIRATRPQGQATVRSRIDNVRGAFALRDPHAVCGRDVVLVDDVFTTGATARACAAVLRAAGARTVVLLAACRS